MRKVVVYEWKKAQSASHFEKEATGHGVFLEFGLDYEETEAGIGNFSTAIVEMPDGTVKNVPVELIVFNN